MTAHPKIDARTGEMLFFGYMAAGPGSPDISFTVVDRTGAVTRTETFKAPFASMVHDFAITDRHVIFPVFPATIDIPRIMKGGPMIAWDPEQGSRIGIMPRDASTSQLRWFTGPAVYAYHPLNAWSDGATVVLELCVYPRVPLFPNADGSRAPADLADAPARLERWTFDLAGDSNEFRREPVDDLATEFPRIDDRWTGLRHRHGYAGAIIGEKLPGSPFDTLVHYDMATGMRETWTPGPGQFVMEPVVAPRSGATAEADGYVLTLVYRAADNRSDLVVLDASNLKAGPIASAKLPMRVPFGFHGNWVAA
jgi:carotenoid cleavage dioxygenase